MAKLDKLKEEIGWLRIVFGILIAVDISLVAWVVQNYNKADIFLLVISTIVAIMTTGGIVWINKAAYRRIDELEDL